MIDLLTVQELQQAPTGIDWTSIAESAGSQDPAQVIESTNVIGRSTFWAANYCGMPQGLHATEQTEQARTASSAAIGDQVWIDKDGVLNFKCATTPVLSVVSSQWAPLIGAAPIVQPITAAGWQITGSYPFNRHLINATQGWFGLRARPAMVQVTYVSGWANAVLTEAATAGSGVELAVDTTFGMSVGQLLTVYDGGNTETVSVADVPDGETVMVTTLANNHNAGVGVSAVPPDIKQAVILACVHFARQRGDLVVGLAQAGTAKALNITDSSFVEAMGLLDPYVVQI